MPAYRQTRRLSTYFPQDLFVENGGNSPTCHFVTDPSSHLDDFHLAQLCIEGDVSAISRMQETLGPTLRAYLIKATGLKHESEEIVDGLWADILTPGENRGPRLLRYNGTCALATWLRVVALNLFLTRQRSEKRWRDLAPALLNPAEEGEGEAGDPAWLSDPAVQRPGEEPLIQLMRESLEKALAECDPEDFVLLLLSHYDGLKGFELAKMFGCHPSAISRRLKDAGEAIAEATVAHIRATDSKLDLRREDFMELYRTASPSWLGE